MKKTKVLFNCLAIILLILLFLQYMGHLVRPQDVDEEIAFINSFHTIPENAVEVIGFGSSHMWRGLDPSVMYKEYGIAAYNYGCNWQKCNTTSLFIQDALRTQKPKVILVEAFALHDMLMGINVNGEVYYTRAIPEFGGKQRYLKQCFGYGLKRWLSYYVPLYGFHDNWVNISKASFAPISDGTDLYSTFGFMGSSAVTPVCIPDNESVQQLEFSELALSEIKYIIQVCEDNDTEIVFYVAPWEGEYHYSEAMKKLAQEHGLPFIDMFERIDEVGLRGETDFSDAGHLNTSGAQKVARFLGQYLKENYELTDMRLISDNFWEKNLQE